MANSNEIKTICACQYISTLSNAKDTQETEDEFNIHEIDEEESETEETASSRYQNFAALDQDNRENNEDMQETKDVLDDESTYTDESFYSDEFDKHEISNITLGSLSKSSSSSVQVTDTQRKSNSKNSGSPWRDDDSYSLEDRLPHSTIGTKSRRCKRWNMTFTDEEMRKIEQENELLLRKIMAQQKPRHNIPEDHIVPPRTSSSAINRKKLQKKIEDDNAVCIFSWYFQCLKEWEG